MTPLPCPFCGGDAERRAMANLDPTLDTEGRYVDCVVTRYEQTGCPECGVWFYSVDEPEGTTTLAWNRRA